MDINAYGQGSQFAYFSNTNFTSSKVSGDDQSTETSVEEMEKQNLQPVSQKETSDIAYGQATEENKVETTGVDKAEKDKKENDPLSFYEREFEKQQQLKEKRIEELKEMKAKEEKTQEEKTEEKLEADKREKAEDEKKKDAMKEQQAEDTQKQAKMHEQMMQQLGSQFVIETAGTVEGIKNRLHQEDDKALKLNSGVIPTAGGASFTV